MAITVTIFKDIMATSNASSHDALLLIRQSIASQKPCIPTTTEDPSNSSDVDLSLATASYLHFTGQQASLPLTTPTRFILSNKPVDLRSIYVAWLKQDLGIAEYHAFVSGLNEELATVKQGEGVQTLSFVERVDLITYLEASSEESEFIKPLAADVANASAAARIASGAVAGSTAANVGPQDARLLELYNGERKMGDRNTVLRGVKPMVRVIRLGWTSTDGKCSGFYICAKTRCTVQRTKSSKSGFCKQYKSTNKFKGTSQTTRSDYPLVTIGFLSSSYVKYQVLPRRRSLHSSRFFNSYIVILRLYITYSAPSAINRHQPASPLHYC